MRVQEADDSGGCAAHSKQRLAADGMEPEFACHLIEKLSTFFDNQFLLGKMGSRHISYTGALRALLDATYTW